MKGTVGVRYLWDLHAIYLLISRFVYAQHFEGVKFQANLESLAIL